MKDNKNRKYYALCMFIILLVSLIIPVGSKPAYADGGAIIAHTKQEVIDKWSSYKPLALGTNPYVVQPVTAAPYQAGKLQPQFLLDGLHMLNFLRYLSGMPDDVELDESLSNLAQHGIVVITANNELTHFPSRPAQMDDAFYATGYSGTSQSNLTTASTGNPLSTSVLTLMIDENVENMTLGHRLWQLNPQMKKTGFGYANAKGGGAYASVFVKDESRQEDVNYTAIAYPSAGYFPSEFLLDQPWSLSLNGQAYARPDAAKIQVELVRQSDGHQWNFSNADGSTGDKRFYVSHAEYGAIGNTIVFYTKDLANAGSREDTYRVRVKGLQSTGGSPAVLEYEVNAFALMQQNQSSTGLHTAAPGEALQYRGLAIDKATNQPIAGVEAIFMTNEQVVGSIFSDSSGRIQAAGLPEGSYQVKFRSPDYISNGDSLFYASSRFANISVPTEIRNSFTLADVAGRIVDQSGKPVEGVRVTIGDNIETTDRDGIYLAGGLTKNRTYVTYVEPDEASKYESQHTTFQFTQKKLPDIVLTEKKTSTEPTKPVDEELSPEQIVALKAYWNAYNHISEVPGTESKDLSMPKLQAVTPYYKIVDNRSVADYVFRFTSGTENATKKLTYHFRINWALEPKGDGGLTTKVIEHTGSGDVEVRNDVPPRVFGNGISEIIDRYDHWGQLSDVKGIGYVQAKVSDQTTGKMAASEKYWFDFSDPEHPKAIPPAKDYYKAFLPFDFKLAKFDDIYVFINNVQQTYEQKPVIVEGTTLVPLRGIFEKLGAKVDWDSATRTVTATKGSTKVVLTVGRDEAFVNGIAQKLEQASQIMNGSTMVPLRFVGEAFKASVEWDDTYRSIRIATVE